MGSLLALLVLCVCSRPICGMLQHQWDVTKFGADPTGTNDSTAAIQQTFDTLAASASNCDHFFAPGSHFNYDIWQPAVWFPSGHYIISDTINISAIDPTSPVHNLTSLQIHGFPGVAAIKQTNPSRDIFSGDNCWQLTFERLSLNGGRHQLHIGNNNTGGGFFKVSDVSFSVSSGVAINIRGPNCFSLDPAADCAAQQPIYVGSFSSKLTIRDCNFWSCDQALVNWCDWALLESCSLVPSPDMGNKAVVENYHHLSVRDVIASPSKRTNRGGWSCGARGGSWVEAGQRWFDNIGGPWTGAPGGKLHVQNFRFGGECGGFTTVVNRASYLCVEEQRSWPWPLELCGPPPHGAAPFPSNVSNKLRTTTSAGGAVLIIEKSVMAGGWDMYRNASIVLEEIPGQLILRDNQFDSELGTDGIDLIRAPGLDLDGPYMKQAAVDFPAWAPRFHVDDANWNAGIPRTVLPEQLRPYQTNPVRMSAPPTRGVWRKGQRVWNNFLGSAAEEFAAGWICTAGGTPGKWANISL